MDALRRVLNKENKETVVAWVLNYNYPYQARLSLESRRLHRISRKDEKAGLISRIAALNQPPSNILHHPQSFATQNTTYLPATDLLYLSG